jgi:hypothetical protein
MGKAMQTYVRCISVDRQSATSTLAIQFIETRSGRSSS